MAQFPELEPPLVETSIGEVEEPVEKSDQANAIWYNTSAGGQANGTESASGNRPKAGGSGDPNNDRLPASNAKRSLTDRYSYRAAIYKNIGEECE